jgi:hypothetical protein
MVNRSVQSNSPCSVGRVCLAASFTSITALASPGEGCASLVGRGVWCGGLGCWLLVDYLVHSCQDTQLSQGQGRKVASHANHSSVTRQKPLSRATQAHTPRRRHTARRCTAAADCGAWATAEARWRGTTSGSRRTAQGPARRTCRAPRCRPTVGCNRVLAAQPPPRGRSAPSTSSSADGERPAVSLRHRPWCRTRGTRLRSNASGHHPDLVPDAATRCRRQCPLYTRTG